MTDQAPPRDVTVTAQCIGCGARREIRAGEIAPDDMPMCDQCMMPMIAVSAKVRLTK